MVTASVRHGREAFTLVELLVVIAVIGLLIAVLLPAVQAARESSRRSACANNCRQLGLGVQNHESARKKFPTGQFNIPTTGTLANKLRRSWAVPLLPYIEQQAMGDDFDLSLHWAHINNQPVVSRRLQSFECPSNPDLEHTLSGVMNSHNYVAATGDYAPYDKVEGISPNLVALNIVDVAGRGALFQDEKGAYRPNDVLDGLSNTIFIGECAGRPKHYITGHKPGSQGPITGAPWASHEVDFGLDGSDKTGALGGAANPIHCAINCTNNNEAYSFHPGGAQFVFGDGSVHFLNAAISIRIFARLATPRGGESVAKGSF